MIELQYLYNWIFGHNGLPVAAKVALVVLGFFGVVLVYLCFSFYHYKLAKMYGFSDWMVRMCWLPIFQIVPSIYIYSYAISKVFDTKIKETIVVTSLGYFLLMMNFRKLTFLTDTGIVGLVATVVSVFVYTAFYLYYSRNAYLGFLFSFIGIVFPTLNLILPLIMSLTTIKHTDGYGHWEDLFKNLSGEDSEAVLLQRAEKRLKDNLEQATKIGNESDLEYKVDSAALENIRDQKLREDGLSLEKESNQFFEFGVDEAEDKNFLLEEESSLLDGEPVNQEETQNLFSDALEEQLVDPKETQNLFSDDLEEEKPTDAKSFEEEISLSESLFSEETNPEKEKEQLLDKERTTTVTEDFDGTQETAEEWLTEDLFEDSEEEKKDLGINDVLSNTDELLGKIDDVLKILE